MLDVSILHNDPISASNLYSQTLMIFHGGFPRNSKLLGVNLSLFAFSHPNCHLGLKNLIIYRISFKYIYAMIQRSN